MVIIYPNKKIAVRSFVILPKQHLWPYAVKCLKFRLGVPTVQLYREWINIKTNDGCKTCEECIYNLCVVVTDWRTHFKSSEIQFWSGNFEKYYLTCAETSYLLNILHVYKFYEIFQGCHF